MLKDFFEMLEGCGSGKERVLSICGDTRAYVASDEGKSLVLDQKGADQLNVQGELDKLAANISIGRNMAGVHYYSYYYDSLRMGEWVAVGILMEHCPS